jgi:hypothetical protein
VLHSKITTHSLLDILSGGSKPPPYGMAVYSAFSAVWAAVSKIDQSRFMEHFFFISSTARVSL